MAAAASAASKGATPEIIALPTSIDETNRFEAFASDTPVAIDAQAQLEEARAYALSATNRLEAIYAELHRALHGTMLISLVPENQR
ncbi:hypothetical protein G6L67_00355 [Agrobacterium tumefaciens]|uniref:hypothetical protein n=1 Tax=Agrobacterium tumefaciens TaxID=358 RepID=UPI000EF6230D|nr:hypothetical protein [Agrobacterium tumefaciens]AYM84028.1 hypothetical protein At12D1_41460 [Agrobacterium tumefaciens]NTE90294.1 hypothetical protein [Agrobacterium tumefaciens]